jgi:hypothetical protein
MADRCTSTTADFNYQNIPQELYANQTDHTGYVTIANHDVNSMYHYSIQLLSMQFISGYVQLSQCLFSCFTGSSFVCCTVWHSSHSICANCPSEQHQSTFSADRRGGESSANYCCTVQKGATGSSVFVCFSVGSCPHGASVQCPCGLKY